MRGFLKWAAALVTCGALVLGWIAVGQRASEGLRHRGRFAFAFADIDCLPAPPVSRADFLSEVQYLSGLPDELLLPDEDLAGRLATAFAAHPLVAAVERVEALPRQVRVTLTYRTGVLAVPVEG